MRGEVLMQFRDLKQQYQLLKKDIDEAIIKVTTDCNFISGSQAVSYTHLLKRIYY